MVELVRRLAPVVQVFCLTASLNAQGGDNQGAAPNPERPMGGLACAAEKATQSIIANGLLGAIDGTTPSQTQQSDQATPCGASSAEAARKVAELVDPAEFKFETVVEDDGKGPSGGWRQTECITIRFLRSPSFLRPVEFFDVRFRVGAPIRNHRGRIPEWFAVDKSVEAATAAGLELIAMLRAGTASQADAQIVFPKKMTLFLQGSIPGALSTGCSASGKKLGVTLQM